MDMVDSALERPDVVVVERGIVRLNISFLAGQKWDFSRTKSSAPDFQFHFFMGFTGGGGDPLSPTAGSDPEVIPWGVCRPPHRIHEIQ